VPGFPAESCPASNGIAPRFTPESLPHFDRNPQLSPHPLHQLVFPWPHGIGLYGCGRELGMPEQLLERVERHAAGDCFDTKPMTESFGRACGPAIPVFLCDADAVWSQPD
jgi:hypothetical protein